MVGGQREPVLPFQIQRVGLALLHQTAHLGLVDVSLHMPALSRPLLVLPARHHVGARELGGVRRIDRSQGGLVQIQRALLSLGFIDIALHGDGVGRCRGQVGSEPGPLLVPGVVRRLAGAACPARRFCRAWHRRGSGRFRPARRRGEWRQPAFQRARLGFDIGAFGVLGVAGDDVDHAVDGVGTPQRAARTADHLDALHVFQQNILGFPVGAAEQRGIEGAAVLQHQRSLHPSSSRCGRKRDELQTELIESVTASWLGKAKNREYR